MSYEYHGMSVGVEELLGKTFSSVKQKGDDAILLLGEESFIMMHAQDCCEQVYIEDIDGELDVLENSPITMAECSHKEGDGSESETWTFYKLGTTKGSVTIRAYGCSSGYYGETMDLYKYREEG